MIEQEEVNPKKRLSEEDKDIVKEIINKPQTRSRTRADKQEKQKSVKSKSVDRQIKKILTDKYVNHCQVENKKIIKEMIETQLKLKTEQEKDESEDARNQLRKYMTAEQFEKIMSLDLDRTDKEQNSDEREKDEEQRRIYSQIQEIMEVKENTEEEVNHRVCEASRKYLYLLSRYRLIKYPNETKEAETKEIKQILDKEVLGPCDPKTLTSEDW